ncbi:trehalose-phosphatase [Cellulomonas sp. PhB143]|uniref:trehalose-phosphatase n=1 Tax=Cellulomonas sp. PhB143 TaxID=2485186 RepID=UPI000F46CB86|nr:trehalose-phosphatase [Cellulomonas sp. PhB143]ROS78787.1 trehalose 6-phosphatase [Cellulomonas sp. PhB143]
MHEAAPEPAGQAAPEPAGQAAPDPALQDALVALQDALVALAARRPVLVALDFDGTLAPLVDDPTTSRMLPGSRAALDRLAQAFPGVRTALVSGRDLTQLAELADPPPGTLLVGSHGAETGEVAPDGVRAVPVELDDERRRRHTDLVSGFQAAAQGRHGVWVETKPTAAVLHTRLAGEEDTHAAQGAAQDVVERLGLRAMHGKDVIEVAVVETSKGAALERLRERLAQDDDVAPDRVAVLYAGDDTTDERAFEVLGEADVTVKVGQGATAARYRVATPWAFEVLLGRLADAVDAAAAAQE